jgi:hypothetical protein
MHRGGPDIQPKAILAHRLGRASGQRAADLPTSRLEVARIQRALPGCTRGRAPAQVTNWGRGVRNPAVDSEPGLARTLNGPGRCANGRGRLSHPWRAQRA